MNAQSNVITLLPPLVFNQSFFDSFGEQESPCAALGLVEIRKKETGFIAIKTGQTINSANGFELGAQLLGSKDFAMLHLIFSFGQGWGTYDVLLNLNTPAAKKAMSVWEKTGEYFFFVFHDSGMAAFNNKIGQEWHDYNFFEFTEKANNSASQFERAEKRFTESDIPHGTYLDMVFLNNSDFLDLSQDRLELKGNATGQ